MKRISLASTIIGYMTAALKVSLLRTAAETEELCLAVLRSIAATLEHESSLKAVSAQRERDQAIALRDDALEQWKTTEKHLDILTKERDALQAKIDAVTLDNIKLQGRFEGIEPFLELVREAKRLPSTRAHTDAGDPGVG